MQVLSVNIAQVRRISYRGEEHQTGIFKHATEGPVQVKRLGLAGDRQCDLLNHGGEHKAVYGLAQEHYEHWRAALDQPQLGPGDFGENLTVSGLDEAVLCIGDRLAIGSTLLEVSQPRVPCFKLGVALGDDSVPGQFTRHFHTGVYFRVIQEGQLQQGDGVEGVHKHPAGISIYSLFRAYYDRDLPDRNALLAEAMQLEALAPEWRDKIRKRR